MPNFEAKTLLKLLLVIVMVAQPVVSANAMDCMGRSGDQASMSAAPGHGHNHGVNGSMAAGQGPGVDHPAQSTHDCCSVGAICCVGIVTDTCFVAVRHHAAYSGSPSSYWQSIALLADFKPPRNLFT